MTVSDVEMPLQESNPHRRVSFDSKLTKLNAANRPHLFSLDLDEATMHTDCEKRVLGRRYSIGSNMYGHMKHELAAPQRHHEVDLNASLDVQLHRSISKLFD